MDYFQSSPAAKDGRDKPKLKRFEVQIGAMKDSLIEESNESSEFQIPKSHVDFKKSLFF